jgi:hypothetical protein
MVMLGMQSAHRKKSPLNANAAWSISDLCLAPDQVWGACRSGRIARTDLDSTGSVHAADAPRPRCVAVGQLGSEVTLSRQDKRGHRMGGRMATGQD